MEISRQLYPEKESDALVELWNDESSSIRHLIAKNIGKRLQANKEILGHPNEQLMALLSLAGFANSEEECVYVYGVVKSHISNPDPFPLVSKHKGYDLASRCLVSLGFFEQQMEKRTIRYQAPKPEFYRNVGAKTFQTIGRNDVSEHFQYWEYFFKEILV